MMFSSKISIENNVSSHSALLFVILVYLLIAERRLLFFSLHFILLKSMFEKKRRKSGHFLTFLSHLFLMLNNIWIVKMVINKREKPFWMRSFFFFWHEYFQVSNFRTMQCECGWVCVSKRWKYTVRDIIDKSFHPENLLQLQWVECIQFLFL